MTSENPAAGAGSSHRIGGDTEIGDFAGTKIDELHVAGLSVASGNQNDEKKMLPILRKKGGKGGTAAAAEGDDESSKRELEGKTKKGAWGQADDDALVVLLKEHGLYESPNPSPCEYSVIWKTIYAESQEEGNQLKGREKAYIHKKATGLRDARKKEIEVQKKAMDNSLKVKEERLKALEEEINKKEQILKQLEDDRNMKESLSKALEKIGGGGLDKNSDEWKSLVTKISRFINERCEKSRAGINQGVIDLLEEVFLKKN